MANIYVGNLPFQTTEEELRGMFSEFGPVDNVNIIIDRMSGRSRGFGFVEMSDGNAVQAAITALNGKDINGRPLTVNEARSRAEGGAGGGGRREGGGGGHHGGRDRE